MKKTLLTIALCLTLILTLAGCKKITLVSNNYETSQNVSKLVVTDVQMDIEVKKSADEKIRVQYYELDEEYYYSFSYNNASSTLRVERKEKVIIGGHKISGSYKTVVYVPENYDGSIEITTVVGNITVEGVAAKSIKTTTTTGNVTYKNANVSEETKVKITTGSFNLKNSQLNSIDLENVNGSTDIEDTDFKGDVIIKINNGDLNMDSVITESKFDITISNGETIMKKIDFKTLLSVVTTTGATTLSLNGAKKEYTLNTQYEVGSVNVDDFTQGNKSIYIKTEVGDISVKFLG